MMVAQQPIDKVGDGRERQFGGFAIRDVPNAWKHRRLDRTEAFLLRRLDLLECAVLIAFALHDQDRHADVAERIGDVPLAEVWIEPRLVPRAERAIDIGMPAPEFFAKRAGDERLAHTPDFGKS